MKKFALILLSLLVLLLLLLGLTYASLPWLAQEYATRNAHRFGLEQLEVVVGYPDLQRIDVQRVTARAEGFALEARDGQVTYSWAALRAGMLDEMVFAEADVTVLQPTPDETEVSTSPPSLESAFGLVPAQRLAIAALSLDVPHLDFRGLGQLDISPDTLTVVMDGLSPEEAERYRLDAMISAEGQLALNFVDRKTTSTEPFVVLTGQLEQNSLALNGSAQLGDFPLRLITAAFGLPEGTGQLQAELALQTAWPMHATRLVETTELELSRFALDWQGSDGVRLNGLQGEARINQGRVEADVAGSAEVATEAGKISIQLPRTYALRYDGSVLTGTGEAEFSARLSDYNVSGTLGKFVLRDQQVAEFDGDFVVANDAPLAGGDLTGTVNLLSSTPLTLKSDLRFKGWVGADRDQADVVGTLALADDKVQASGKLDTAFFKGADFNLAHNLTSSRGQLTGKFRMEVKAPLFKALFADWDEPYEVTGGVGVSYVTLGWTSDAVTVQADLALQNIAGRYDDYTFVGLGGQLKLDSSSASDFSQWSFGPTPVAIAEIDVGFPLRETTLVLAMNGDLLEVQDLKLKLLGGTATITPFSYDLNEGATTFDILLDNVDLAEVLALEGGDITGTGQLQGRLPVVIEAGEAAVVDGLVKAAGGGTIMLSESLAQPTGQPNLDFALTALQNFAYSELNAAVNYSRNGDLLLGVTLKGRNPAVEKGRPIHYNLNISENIPVLLESLRMQDQVTERVERQIKK